MKASKQAKREEKRAGVLLSCCGWFLSFLSFFFFSVRFVALLCSEMYIYCVFLSLSRFASALAVCPPIPPPLAREEEEETAAAKGPKKAQRQTSAGWLLVAPPQTKTRTHAHTQKCTNVTKCTVAHGLAGGRGGLRGGTTSGHEAPASSHNKHPCPPPPTNKHTRPQKEGAQTSAEGLLAAFLPPPDLDFCVCVLCCVCVVCG
jgi:hypothetical protein